MATDIQIDDDVLDFLKAHAEPFVDTTPNAVIRRLLGIDGDAPVAERGGGPVPGMPPDGPRRPRVMAVVPPDNGRAIPGTILAESEYELPTLRYLVKVGGEAPSREVIEAIGRELDAEGRLTHADKLPLRSGEIRWRSRAAFARMHLVRGGYVDGNAPHGIWRITDKGRRRVEEES
jgi:hypothetical protein